jgi:hypothetical protein
MIFALIAVALLTSPAVVSAIIEWSAARDPGMLRRYIDPSVVTLWSASVIVPVLLVIAHRLFPCASAPAAVCAGYRVAFFSTAIVFALLNVTNWCRPGWCERFGFPLPYSWWSDAIMVMNGRNITAGASIAAFVVNLTALAAAFYAMARRYQRYR